MSVLPADAEELAVAEQAPARPAPKIVRTPWLRTTLKVGGVAAVVAGVIGIVVPGIPTTPFLLLAAWAFARSSPRFLAWLLDHKWFGPPLRRWREDRTISVRSKLTATALVAITAIPTVGWVLPFLWMKVLFLGGGGLALTAMWNVPSERGRGQ